MAVSLETFNPAIDRYDIRSAARMFRSLWPDAAVSRAVAVNLASSIRAAHRFAEASWEVTMFSNELRLNVGQVETLTLRKEKVRFLFKSPLELSSAPRFEIRSHSILKDAPSSRANVRLILTDSPFYPAVPVPSGVCVVPLAELPFLPSSVREAHEAYIEAAASFKRISPWKKSFSPAVLEYIELALGAPLPRPSYLTTTMTSPRVDPLADELDPTQPLLEGARYPVTVNAYERDPRARQLCIHWHGTACVICGFSFGAVYGPAAADFIHVHHLRPMSEIGSEYEVDPIEDLRPVCPNCHAVIHRRAPVFTIDEVRALLNQQTHAES